MQHILPRLAIAVFALLLPATTALAHAFLDTAAPGVGSTITSSPSELQLKFTQNLVLAFSSVQLARAHGGTVATGKPTLDASSPDTLHVSLGRPLAAGTYIVSWKVLSVDTHTTSGTYKFTISP
jgi:methionine-rich copper-binding protein CopC